ncbi:MAG: GGDEF domain-containing protein [Thiobacillus sp.]|nr:GGDEF domain-containing protein [Thiobacillus sp.]
MRPVNRISLRTLTISLVGLLALLAVLAQVLAAQYFRGAALAAQHQSLAHIVEVASAEVLRQLEAQLISLGTEFQNRPEFKRALSRFQREGERDALPVALQDPFTHGFVGVRTTDLVKLRIFDTKLQFVAESKSEIDFPPGLPAALLKQASNREGANRLKAVGALWPLEQRAYYSVLLPIGGLKLLGYLEVIADPTINLRAIEGMTQMPLAIYGGEGRFLEGSINDGNDNEGKLPIETTLRDSENETLLRLVSLSDVVQLNKDWQQTIWFAVIGVVVLISLAALLVLAILNRFVFKPVDAMKQEMARFAAGDQSVIVGTHMLFEFAVLADAFNAMARELAIKIDQLKHLSRYDSLTALVNRQHFDLCIEQEWRRALRSHEPISLLMIDVDHFKRYNDYYGHVGGDDCLRAVAEILRQVVQRSTDLPARYGGEEFVVLLPNTPLPSAIALAEEILAIFQQRNLPHAATSLGRISVSIGVTTCNTAEACSPSGLVESADSALYEAKHAGRNRLAVAGEHGVISSCDDCSCNDGKQKPA